ncbi:transcription repressor OFP13-like [Henckelia pumila]|uniref:transcription repressor OFP13-like n=1 Tax=Henckelia pumila TaxID=405737 RepID=UPI003C6DC608
MSTPKKKYANLNTVSVNLGCSCRRLKLSSLFHPRPRRRRETYSAGRRRHSSSSSSSWPDTTTTTLSSDDTDAADIKSLRAVQGFGRIGGESVAVEKDSDDPYLDFRQSMLQMILEKQIYSRDDLKELLNCFLQLNSPYYHGIIVRAFTEIWNGVYSSANSAAGSGASSNMHGMWVYEDNY